jgi:hypothetical protein
VHLPNVTDPKSTSLQAEGYPNLNSMSDSLVFGAVSRSGESIIYLSTAGTWLPQ